MLITGNFSFFHSVFKRLEFQTCKNQGLFGKGLNDKNDISVFDTVENIVGKGENAGYQHFLLFPQCFQKACLEGRQKVSLCGNGLIALNKIQNLLILPLSKQVLIFMCLQYKSLKNTVEKGTFPILKLLSTASETFPPFSTNLKLSFAKFFS